MPMPWRPNNPESLGHIKMPHRHLDLVVKVQVLTITTMLCSLLGQNVSRWRLAIFFQGSESKASYASDAFGGGLVKVVIVFVCFNRQSSNSANGIHMHGWIMPLHFQDLIFNTPKHSYSSSLGSYA